MSVREDIVDQIVTELQGITIANGFATDVSTVSLNIRDPDDPPAKGNLPYIGVLDDNATNEPLPAGVNRRRLFVILSAFVAKGPSLSKTAIYDLEQDMFTAIHDDPTLACKAIVATVTSSRVNVGDPDADFGEVLMNVEVIYDLDV